MGSIHLTLDIDRVDLIIAIAVVTIAIIAIIGFIVWLVKASKRNKMLKSIDCKMDEQYFMGRGQNKNDRKCSCGENSKRKEQQQVIEPAKLAENIEHAEYIEEETEKDVLEEIRKMLVSGTPASDDIKDKPKNIAKSGREYTREEIEKLIGD